MLEDRVELPRLYLTWLSPAIFAPGDADLDLAADVLGDGKSSRLYRRMVYERRIATDVTAVQQSRELGGLFQLVATAAPGHSLARARGGDESRELAQVAQAGPTTAELERGLAQAEAQFVYRLQTVGGFGGKSDQLNQYNVFVGDPGYFDRDLRRYREATPASVARGHAARARRRAAGGRQRRAARPPRPGPARFDEGGVLVTADRPLAPADPGARPRLPLSRRSMRRTLPSGLRVRTVEHRGVPVVSFLLLLSSGAAGRSGAAARAWRRSRPTCWTRAAGDCRRSTSRTRCRRSARSSRPRSGSDATVLSLLTLPRFAGRGARPARRHRRAGPRLSRRGLRPRSRAPAEPAPPAARPARRRSPTWLFARVLYAGHPYGHLPIGTMRGLEGDVGRTTCGRSTPARGGRRGSRSSPWATPSHDELFGAVRARLRLAGRTPAPGAGSASRRALRGGRRCPRRRSRRARCPRRPAGRAQSELRIGQVAVAAAHARLPRAARAQHDPRRPVRQPPQHEPARGQGLHLRRAQRLRLQAQRPARSACRRRCRRPSRPTPSARC